MKTIAVRMYGKNDVRLERFDLPEIKDDEILAKVVTDSLCMSSYKAVIQGKEHKRVPDNVYECPVILGHEFCGEIVSVGAKWREKYKAGQRFVIQPALNYNGSLFAPGYSYQYIGGDAQYIIIPNEVMETDNLLKYESDCYFLGSLAEPLSCVIGAFNACYHTEKGRYNHIMGCKPGGKMLILAGCGPMGLGAIDYALHGLENPPELLVVTDVDEERLTRAKELYGNDKTRFVLGSDRDEILSYSENGYDDVFVFAPVAELIELGDGLLCEDGCLNFFAGPTSKDFSSKFNFYNVHYSSTHVVGTSGGNRLDMIASGPATADLTTVSDTLAILDKYNITVNENMLDLIKRETPKNVDNAIHNISGSVSQLCISAKKYAQELGYKAEILRDDEQDEARNVGFALGRLAKKHQNTDTPLAFIIGGETVVNVKGNGKGGRNQEIALSAALEIKGIDNVCVFSVGSDGTDGPTDCAGGIADGKTYDLIKTAEELIQQGINN